MPASTRRGALASVDAPKGPQPMAAEFTKLDRGEGAGRPCIYKIKAGSLLFRRGGA